MVVTKSIALVGMGLGTASGVGGHQYLFSVSELGLELVYNMSLALFGRIL